LTNRRKIAEKCRRRSSRLPEALACADEAIWLDRKAAAGYRERGWIHLDRDDPVRAMDDLDQALRLDEDDALAYRLRGEAKQARNDPRAAADFDAALQRAASDARAWMGRGVATGSSADLTQALAREPTLATAYLERGTLRLVLMPELALDDLAEAVRLRPSLRASALARIRRHATTLDATQTGRLALGAISRFGSPSAATIWRELADDPEKRSELLRLLEWR